MQNFYGYYDEFYRPLPSLPGIGGQQQQVPSVPSHIMSEYQNIVNNPTSAQHILHHGGLGQGYAVGCDMKWTIIQLKTGQVFLMFVFSASATGNTTGIIFPAFTFGSFPTSSILAYKC
ncbi:hypothetical protein P9G40_19315 [Bacillus velezensis]|uniref:hypothetical protein n=1 Tax=Bacillus amyloliquefaciens group TaxID=1938374 RepID=UPI0009882357|nr:MULTISPECIES: hypothetical protein [Bacillus amyloliquefaciens group]AQS44194.1 hypothetical protein BVH55_09855 [Bacillus velezensis]ASS60697.1 hypothetical protein CHN56_00152 [Bacillus velezensis]ATC53309.1 hypothetical protein CLI97_04086 [Bacillus velezensis]MCW8785905.1 hypothetical protein [Bacillus velezensis]MDM5216848.1 hypothetical protein [Bacillus velezensis]